MTMSTEAQETRVGSPPARICGQALKERRIRNQYSFTHAHEHDSAQAHALLP